MKCVSIVYKRPNTDELALEFRPVRTVKRSVDDYIDKLRQKQQNNKFMGKTLTTNFKSNNSAVQTSRLHRIMKSVQMIDSMNVVRLKYSTQNIFKQQDNLQHGDNKNKAQKKFRSTFVKRKQPTNAFYSLKGIKLNNDQLFEQKNLTLSPTKNQLSSTVSKPTAKLLCLKKLKLIKPTTILVSVDFILNQNNFWQQERIDQNAHKNWKLLQEHSNIVWLARRENTLKKLERYAGEFGLRLDGVYKIAASKKAQTLLLSLAGLEKDYAAQYQSMNGEDGRREVIVINSLKVETIKDVGFQQFYSAFPVAKSLRCIVHFIQIDMSDKNRFSSPLKVLSKQKLPQPNSINHLFISFFNTHSSNTLQAMQLYRNNIGNSLQQQQQGYYRMTNQQMMEIYQSMKGNFLNYFGNHLRINLNNKVKVQSTETSVQYLIGDMLKRNFTVMSNYHSESKKISKNLERIKKGIVNDVKEGNKSSQREKSLNILENNFTKPKLRISLDQLLNSKLKNTKNQQTPRRTIIQNLQQQKYYKQPVFLWKK